MRVPPLFARATLPAIAEELPFLDAHGLLPEVYLPAEALDRIDTADLAPLFRHRELGKDLSFHAPFMDLSPAGSDPRVLEITRYRFTQVRELARALKPKTVVFHPGYDRWRFGFQQETWLDRSRPVWSEVLEWGEALGVRILLENVFETRPDSLAELRRRVGESLGFCFDSGHFLLFSEVGLLEWLEALGDGLAELHLHDNKGDRDSHLPVWEGNFDFGSLFDHLRSNGLQPLTVLEHHTRDSTVRSLRNLERWQSRQSDGYHADP